MTEKSSLAWVKAHLNCNHDDVISTDAIWWFEMMENDYLNFVRFAVYGFALKLGVKDHNTIPGDDIKTFLQEFQLKICLAAAGNSAMPGLQLFAICGLDLISEELLKKDVFRVQPIADA